MWTTHTFNICSSRPRKRKQLKMSRHSEITISSGLAVVTLAVRQAPSIPVSETKIRGSCETAGEVKSTVSRRQAWSDIVNPLANISIRLRIRSATTKMQQENAPRALYTALYSSASRNLGGKKTRMRKTLLYRHPLYFSFVRKTFYANAIIDIEVESRKGFLRLGEMC